ncbi:MAG: N-acetylmuramoyl-L-alanine amidase [Chitinophagaceae bacterium]|nr:N-acetylmuramoyl-L-alanine amidase [Chitinophagaceae bacterium]
MKITRKITYLFLVFAIVSIAATNSIPSIFPPTQKQGLKKIVIDAGHGGSDYGASGKYSHEKDVSLSVALLLEAEIKKEIPDVEVYMTRTTDIYDHVRVKADKANAAKGDLFISIHCNSSRGTTRRVFKGYKTVKVKKGKKTVSKKVAQYEYYTTPSIAKGTETYIWGIDKNEDKFNALKENDPLYADSSMMMEQKSLDDPEQIAAISLRMQQYTERSRNLAYAVQDEFTKVGRVNRDAKQRAVGIWVLQAVAMPAILVELGFISNPDEEDYLNSAAGQKELSESIARAVKQYKKNIETKMSINNR